MKKNKEEFFKILERDYKHNRENKIDVVQLFLLYLCSFSIPGVAINYLFILESSKTFIDYFFCSMFILIGIVIFLMDVFFITSKIRINKKYGNNVKTEMISIIKKECSIDEVQEYYKKASYHFKKNILEKIIRDEISKNLDLKGD